MGIGLHMVSEYTKMHGGQIIVSSTVDQGSCFTVLLPYKHDRKTIKDLKTTSMAESTEKEVVPGDQSACVLFVENNAEFRAYIKKVLSPRYKVITAKNGQQGFEMAVELNPDIIISDIVMPVMEVFNCVME